MRLQIAAWDGANPALEIAMRGGEWACDLLEELAPFQELIKKKNPWANTDDALPRIVREMIASVRHVGDLDLTPLATVAGTISDFVAERLFSQGMSKVIVNNGGDIAIRMLPEAVVRVGVRLDVSSPKVSHGLEIKGNMGIGGITTSGFGGRSFTKGTAQAVVVLGATASVADAASTSIANATQINAPSVKTAVAETIYPDTDLAGEKVTQELGTLTSQEIDTALANGMARVRQYIDKGVIHGGILCVQGRMIWSHGIESFLFP
ncbi:MAG: UPF0280 family protein [Chloroflexi bacterium]|nr:UPF0280 family protein [Chloroflexota bacterium]